MPTLFHCPVCQSALTAESGRYYCDNGHSFDRAKEGYVNLLLANQKKSKEPGDNREMIRSRKAFLGQGYYQKLAEALVEVIETHSNAPDLNLLDAGCGEGYYVNFLVEHYSEMTCYGIDISKDAVRLAAKQYKNIEFAVASVAQLPIQDKSADFVLSIFSPRHLPEMSRIAKDDALLIVVTPGENHLEGLRAIIYDEVQDYKALADDAYAPEFTLFDRQHIEYEIELDNAADIANLLQMTPFYWHVSQEKQAQLLQLERLSLSVSFVLTVWKKSA